MKHVILWAFCCICFIPALSGQVLSQEPPAPETPAGAVSGKVTTIKGSPAPDVIVGIEQTGKGSLTDREGKFTLGDLTPGNLVVAVSGIGIVPQKKDIVLEAGEALTVNFVVHDTLRKLKEVTVTYSRNKFATKSSDYVARMPLPNLENPQAYTVIPQSVIREQMVVGYTDAFKNIPGTEIPSVANNGRVDISSRGFKVRSQIVDGVSGYTMTAIDPANIEKIEVVRGPSATLFGSSLTSYGGLVNIVTKQPYKRAGGAVSYTNGSFGLNRLTIDANTPLNKKKTLLFRINGAGQAEKSYLDAGFAKSIFAAPAFSYRVNDRLSIDAGAEYYNREATSPFWFVPYKKTDLRDARDLSMNYDLSFSNNDVHYNARQLDVRARVYYKISDAWKSRTIFSSTHNGMGGPMLSLTGVSDSTLTRSISAGPQHFSTTEVQQNFLNDRTYGKIRNRLLIGLDYYHYKTNASVANIKADTVNFIYPGANYANFNHSLVGGRLANASYNKTSADQSTYSAYASDVVTLNKRWSAMLSLRLDRFENKGTPDEATGKMTGGYGQTALSPKLGLVYQPIKDRVSLYANYMNGFKNVNGTDYAGNSFKPQQADQLEGGIKVELLHGRLAGTVSYYHIRVSNILRDDPDHLNYSIQNGTELSRGAEVSASANPVKGLNILAGYAYNLCEYQKADDGMSGRRPDGAGPQNTANLWISYTLSKGKIKGLGIGAGGIYGSHLTAVKSFKPEFNVPGYAVLDATVFYQHSFYRLGFKLNNVTNERYWNNRLQLQPPRSFAANITVKF